MSKKDRNKLLEMLLANGKISEFEYLSHINLIDLCTAKKYLQLLQDPLLSGIIKQLHNIQNLKLLNVYINAFNEGISVFATTIKRNHNRIFYNVLNVAYLNGDIEMIENLSNDDNSKRIIELYDHFISSFKWDMTAINFICKQENVTFRYFTQKERNPYKLCLQNYAIWRTSIQHT